MFTYLVLLPFVALFVLWAFTYNFLKHRDEPWYTTLEAEEVERDRVEIRGLLGTTRMVLTDRRLLEQRVGWPFVRRMQRAVALEDIRSVSWRASVSIGLLALAFILFGRLNPLALLLVLYALQTPIAAVRFHTSYLFLPTVQPAIRAVNRADHSKLARFYACALGTLLQFQAVRQPAAPRRPPLRATAETSPGYAWSRTLWLHLLLLMALAVIGRLSYGHVVMTDLVLAPLYLGLTIAVAYLGTTADAIWAGVLSPLMVLAVKFPAGLLTAFLLNDGNAHLGECAVMLFAFVLAALGARWLGSLTHLPVYPFAALAWPAVVLLADRVGTRDLAFVAQLPLAMAAALLGSWFYEELERLPASLRVEAAAPGAFRGAHA